jgi:hypothetical protein
MVELNTAVTITIVDKASGKSVTYKEPQYYDSPYMWEEGNYSCDCNRKLFFIREKEGREPTKEETPCNSGKNRFLVKVVYRADGCVVWNELDDN